MAEYFLPDVNQLGNNICDYEIRILKYEDFEEFFTCEWPNALNVYRRYMELNFNTEEK